MATKTPCFQDGHELSYRAILIGLLEEGRLGNGSVLDAGASLGHESCAFAESAASRRVHALDPSPHNVKFMRSMYAGEQRPNLLPRVAALGENLTRLKVKYQVQGNQHFTVFPTHAIPWNQSGGLEVLTIDDLFGEYEQLALMHLDLEGSELPVLKGSTRTIEISRPVVATELFVHKDPMYSSALLDFMEARGYRSYLIDEVCGHPVDCRNLIHFPIELRDRLTGSPILNLALSSRVMLPVTSHSISKLAFPCCKPGGDCCPAGAVRTGKRDCCSTGSVYRWMCQHSTRPPFGVEGSETAVTFEQQPHLAFKLSSFDKQLLQLDGAFPPGSVKLICQKAGLLHHV